MMTKMTGFDKSAYNQSNFEYEEIVQEDDNSRLDISCGNYRLMERIFNQENE